MAPAAKDSADRITLDANDEPTEPVLLEDSDACQVEIVSADERLGAVLVSRGTLALSSTLPDAGAYDAFLALKADGNFFTLAFHKGMGPVEVLTEFQRGVPPGYAVESAGTTSGGVGVVTLLQKASPSARGPRVRFGSSDPSQLVKWAGPNRFTIEGRAARGLTSAAWVQLEVDGEKPVQVQVHGGDTPFATAERIRAALPHGLAAQFEPPKSPDQSVTVTIVRRRG